MQRTLPLTRAGRLPYGQALATQHMLRSKLQDPDATALGHVLVLEHPPTVTIGKRGSIADLIAPELLTQQGIEVHKVDRGGEATFHEPGQLVVYPIVHLQRLGMGVVDLIRGMADTLANVVAEYDVEVSYDPKVPGLWTQEIPSRRKLASVGMRVSGGVTTHGVAINLVNDLHGFSLIVPCGMPESQLVSLKHLTTQGVDADTFTASFLQAFATFLDVTWVDTPIDLPDQDTWSRPLTLG